MRDTPQVLGAGVRRQRLARTLNTAYAEGLISDRTLAQRLDALFAGELIDPARLVGDLSLRVSRRRLRHGALTALTAGLRRTRVADRAQEAGIVLALDWTGAREDLLIGRHPSCDVVVADDTVSRRHARLTFRDGGWIVQDLDSTNGTRLNGHRVGRCRLRPGDQLALGQQFLQVD